MAQKINWLDQINNCAENRHSVAKEILQKYKKSSKSSAIFISENAQVTYLYLHSYSLHPTHHLDNADFIRKLHDQGGLNIVAPTLSAHEPNSKPEDFKSVRFEDWWLDAELFLKLAGGLGKRVVLHGSSLGGLLSIQLAIKFPDLLDQLVLTSPALMLAYGSEKLAHAASLKPVRYVARKIFGNRVNTYGLGDYYDKYLYGLPTVAKSVKEIRAQAQEISAEHTSSDQSRPRKIWNSNLEQISQLAKKIKAETTIIYSRSDQALSTKGLDTFVKNLANAEIFAYPKNQKIKHTDAIRNHALPESSQFSHDFLYKKILRP